MERLLNVKDVAKLLQISASCVYKKAENAEIASVKIGTALRFTEANVFDYLQKCERDAKDSVMNSKDKSTKRKNT
jgi:excisionase family DNA binding protein